MYTPITTEQRLEARVDDAYAQIDHKTAVISVLKVRLENIANSEHLSADQLRVMAQAAIDECVDRANLTCPLPVAIDVAA